MIVLHHRAEFGAPTACGLGFLAHAVTDWARVDCPECLAERRREILRQRACRTDNTQRAFTRGFPKADALQFWVDAEAIGLAVVGQTARGEKIYGLPHEASE